MTINPARKERQKVVMLAVALGVALAVVAYSWRRSQSQPESAASTALAQDAAQLSGEAEKLMQSVRGRLAADAERIDVGWVPPPAPEAPAPAIRAEIGRETFKLKGIARDGSHPVAFIDNRTLGIGESIEGYKLIEIGNESVTFLDPRGKRYIVGLYGGD